MEQDALFGTFGRRLYLSTVSERQRGYSMASVGLTAKHNHRDAPLLPKPLMTRQTPGELSVWSCPCFAQALASPECGPPAHLADRGTLA